MSSSPDNIIDLEVGEALNLGQLGGQERGPVGDQVRAPFKADLAEFRAIME